MGLSSPRISLIRFSASPFENGRIPEADGLDAISPRQA
jgi:hypothetical protein